MDDGQVSQPAPSWRPLIPSLTGKYCKPNIIISLPTETADSSGTCHTDKTAVN